MSLKQWLSDIFVEDAAAGRTQGREAPQPSPRACGADRSGAEHSTSTSAKPRLAAVRSAPSRDEFRAWRDDPTTQFVFAALRAAQANQKAAWDELSWVRGEADEIALCEYRTRADAYAGIEEADYEAFCEWAGVQPEGQDAE